MTMKLSNEFNDARNAFTKAIAEGADQEVQAELYGKMIDQLHDDAVKAAEDATDKLMAHNPAEAKMTVREREFFNAVINDPVPAGIEKHLPEETVDRIFEDLTQQHPLLAEVGLRNAGLRLKIYEGETEGHAVWGSLYGEIQGQLTQAFSESTDIQHKLTAFVVLPKDLDQFGPSWLMSFVNTQITEAFAVALESAFLNGDGDQKPIGLSRTLTGTNANGKTTFAEKKATGKFTFADSKTVVDELTEMMKYHSVKEKTDQDGNPIPVVVEGNVVMVVNPSDAWDVKRQYTSLNAQGIYVTAMPFNIKIVESVYQTAGKVTTFVKGRYDAYIASNLSVTKFDQTFALEDRNLWTAKQFAYGKARDERAAAVWTLSIPADKAKA